MGGGNNPRPEGGADGGSGATVVELVVDGKVVRTATGRNLEELNWQSWDVSDLKGKSARSSSPTRPPGPGDTSS